MAWESQEYVTQVSKIKCGFGLLFSFLFFIYCILDFIFVVVVFTFKVFFKKKYIFIFKILFLILPH
jgi:hypothetical protein